MSDLFPPLSALDYIRTVLALLAFGVLPGYLIMLSINKQKEFLAPLHQDAFEAVGVAAIISMALLSLLCAALVFSVGFSVFAIALLEVLLIAGSYWRWSSQ